MAVKKVIIIKTGGYGSRGRKKFKSYKPKGYKRY